MSDIIAEFRSDSTLTTKMRELLSDPTMSLALTVMKSGGMPTSDPLSGNELQSVRLLNQCIGWNDFLDKFLSLGKPVETPPEQGRETWEPETPLE